MKRYIKIFSVFMITILFIIGTVACSKTSEGEKDMTQVEIEQFKEEIKSELKEEIKSELKKEMQTEESAKNAKQETPVTERPRSVESAPTVTEQPTQSDKTEHSDMPKTEPPIIGVQRQDSIENEENFPDKWGVQRPVVE